MKKLVRAELDLFVILIKINIISDQYLNFKNNNYGFHEKIHYTISPINVKLMQVEPVKDIITYKSKSNESVLAMDDLDETNKALWKKANNGDVST